MWITVGGPSGAITRLNLDRLDAYRLELAGHYEQEQQRPMASRLGVGVRYVVGGAATVQFLAAIETFPAVAEVFSIAKTGLPHYDRSRNKQRLHESMKILYQAEGLKNSAAEGMIAKSAALVDAYHDVMEALQCGGGVSGRLDDWRYVVSQGPEWEWPAKKDLADVQPPSD